MMREGREGSEENDNSPSLTFYTLERQTPSNKETNKSKQSHLINQSSFYHMTKGNNRKALATQSHSTVRSNHSQKKYHMLRKHKWVIAYQPTKAPMAFKALLRRSHLSHPFITCLGIQVGRADQEVGRPIAVKARLSNLVMIYI